ncbi:uncharacterized protein B4U80_04989, partial [Leptotrombidium deliense]
YVDDCITILPKSEVKPFHNFLNSLHENIKFTFECEKEKKISFLDVEIVRGDTLITSVYRKPQFSGRHLNFNSHQPINHKRAVINSFADRAYKLCSNENVLENELEFIHKNLAHNDYPKLFVERAIEKVKEKYTSNNSDSSGTEIDSSYMKDIYLPYFESLDIEQVENYKVQFTLI